MTRFSSFRTIAVTAGILMASSFGAFAHDFDPAVPPVGAHGGLLAAGDAGHVEFAAEDGALTIWLTDHGDVPIETEGIEGHAIIQGDAGRINLVLQPAGDNMMYGEDARIAPATGTRISFEALLPDGTPMEGRVIVPDPDMVRAVHESMAEQLGEENGHEHGDDHGHGADHGHGSDSH